MRRTFQFFVAAAMATAIGASLYAQGSVPELQFEAVDLLKTPTDKDIFVGEVAGVATNSRGQIFVYNRTGHPYATLGDSRTFYHGGSRLFVFDSSGKYVNEWGQETYGFNAASGVRVDAQDNVWTLDFGANQVVKFDREGRIQLVLGRKPETIGVRSGGGLMAALWSGPVGTATEGGAPGAAAGGGRGAGGAGGGGGRGAGAPGGGAPAGAAPPAGAPPAGAPAAGARGAAPAGAPGGAAPPAGAAGPGGGRGGGAAPGSGTPGSGMSRPSDIAWDKQGNIFIADGMGNNDRVAKFDKDGRFILHWGSTGAADGQFDGVKGIAIDAQGNVYVADNANKRIQVFDSEGKFKSKMTGFGTPQAMCITPGATQYLYVSHWGNNNGMDDAAIYKVSLTGQVVGKFGSAGKLVKEFGLANSLDCRSENELLVGEMANWRVQRVTVKAAK